MTHILFQKAIRYKQKKEITPPQQYEYDYLIGAWSNTIDKTLLVNSKNFQRIGSKKFDVETGEDHKGQ